MATYWLGLGLLARAIGGRRAVLLLGVGASPLLLGWMGAVVKDSQLVGSLCLAFGLIAPYRLRGRPIPRTVLAVALLCLVYATLVRANAAFSTIPLALLLLPGSALRPLRLLAIPVGIAAALLVSQVANHAVLHAEDSGVKRSEPLYDLAGIALRTGDSARTGLSPGAITQLSAHHCVKPLFWDPLDDVADCEAAMAALEGRTVSGVYVLLARAAIAHPFAYAGHRLAHLNSTERWLVPFRQPLSAAPATTEPNDLGLPDPALHLAHPWQQAAQIFAELPLGWPVVWLALALWGFWTAIGMSADDHCALPIALFGSALCQEASFAVLSISSDLRYHLWPMLAAALGWLLLWRRGLRPRHALSGAVALILLLTGGTAARLILPTPPQDYAALLR
jgi:hypothetical protein